MFFLNQQNRITHATGTLADWFESTQSGVSGTKLTALVSEEDRLALQTALSAIRTQTEPQTRQLTCHLTVGEEQIPVEIELSPVGDDSTLGDIVGTVQPIRNARVAARPISEEDQLQQFIDILDEPTVLYKINAGDPIVQAINAAFEDVFGHHPEHIVGKSLIDYIVPEKDKIEAKDIYQNIETDAIRGKTITRQTVSGLQAFSYRGLTIDNEADAVYGLGIYTDISAEQQARQHLRVLHRVLRHNLRNELTVIFGMAEDIAAHTDSDRTQQSATQIIERAETLEAVSEKARTAEHILGEPPSDNIVDVGAIAEEVATEFQEERPEATITTDIDTSLPVATGVEIRSVIHNLIENAIEHHDGAPTVQVSAHKTAPIHSSTRGAREVAVIRVKDDGTGIPDHERAVIFEDAELTQLKHGAGLGLWVVRWIIESAGGQMSYDRSDGWTTITLRLPLASG